MKNRLIFTSRGLTTATGRQLVAKALGDCDLSGKRIFLFYEPHYFLEESLVDACLGLGFERENIILSGKCEDVHKVAECDYFYCTEGNTFEVLALMRQKGIDDVIKKAFAKGGVTYIGASAGAAIAGVSVEEMQDFDKNFVGMADYSGLGLFDGIIIPHYTKKELERYIKNSPGIENKYSAVLSVANEKSLIMEV